MNTPALIYRFDPSMPRAFSELSRVRLIQPAFTDDGLAVAIGTCGTVVGIWPEAVAYEVDFAVGLATVDASRLVAAG